MSKNAINATHYDRIPAFRSDEKQAEHVVNAIVETPQGSPHKYDLVPEYGILTFKHVLPDGKEWPYDFGFIPQTLAPDGDPLDIVIMAKKGLFCGCLIEVRVIGAILEKKDEVENDRLIGVPLRSPGVSLPTDQYYDIVDVPPDIIDELKDFLIGYSRDQGNEIELRGIADADAAMTSIKRSIKQFRKKST